MKCLRILLPVALLLQLLDVSAQGRNYRSLEPYNLYLQNPAFIKADKYLQVDIIGQSQWHGIQNNPKSILFNSIGTVSKLNSSLRISYEHDMIGFFKTNTFNFAYAYNHQFNEDISVCLGINIQPAFQKLEWENFTDIDYIEELDIASTKGKKTTLDIGLGFSYKNLLLGINSNYTVKDQFETTYFSGEDSIGYFRKGHNYISALAQYKFQLGKKISLKPQLYIDFFNLKNNGIASKINLGFLADYNDRLGTGIFLVDVDRISFTAFVKIVKQLRIYILIYDQQLENNSWLKNNRNYMFQLRFSL